MNINKPKIGLLLGVLCFIGAFQWVYVSWLQPTFGYMGFDHQNPLIGDQILAWTLSVLPVLWLPVHLQRPSQLICWVLYLAVFIPSMFVPLFTQMQEPESIRALMLVMTAGFALTCLSHRFPLLKLPTVALPRSAFWVGYWIVVVGLIAWVVAVYRGHFQLVGFHEVYESLRFRAREVAKGTGVGYAVMWLSGSFIPFLMSWALLRKRPLAFAIGTAVLILLYSTAGLKSILTSIVMTPALYFMMRGDRIPSTIKMVGATVLLFLTLNAANMLVNEVSSFQFLLSAIVFARTFGGPGLLTAMYQDFFANHPLTYYSHINGINLIVPYPYENGIGFEVGYFYSRNLELNSNAHLWCTDGLAAMGLPGILLISALCALVFWILDSAAAGHSPVFSATAVSFTALNLGNVSLFTTLLSGGLFFTILILYVMPREAEETATASEAETIPDVEEEGLLSHENDSPPEVLRLPGFEARPESP